MTLDALQCILAHLRNHWGDYGYRVQSIRSLGYSGGGAAEISHSDGSRFWIVSDRHGAYLAHGDTIDDAVSAYNALRAVGEGTATV